MNHTVVTATRCPLMREPARQSEQVDELLLGWGAEILERAAPGWYRVRSDYGYEGFAPAAALCADQGRAAAFSSLPLETVLRGFCALLAEPRVQSWPVAQVTRGALVAPLGPADRNGWVAAALPDGGVGYIRRGCLKPRPAAPCPEEAAFRRAVAETALSYLGSSYRWGGKSPLGVDCSGLAFMAYWLNGVTIFRDARIEPGFPVGPITPSQLKQGDLLYFPGHMAVYLGEGEYVHATAREGSDGVVLNSLDPAAPHYRADLAGSITAMGSIFCPAAAGSSR